MARPVNFLAHFVECCNEVPECEIVALNINSKDLKEVMHLILDMKEGEDYE